MRTLLRLILVFRNTLMCMWYIMMMVLLESIGVSSLEPRKILLSQDVDFLKSFGKTEREIEMHRDWKLSVGC